ncbi:hypothetical protein C3488_12230 [Streptomyces sp. Ru72]|nr:hypothetical protein C3488_12230 [Streptomyces sp. Ru72]
MRHGRISARHVRGFGAAVVAVAALVTAANAGPARAAEPRPAQTAHRGHTPPRGSPGPLR